MKSFVLRVLHEDTKSYALHALTLVCACTASSYWHAYVRSFGSKANLGVEIKLLC